MMIKAHNFLFFTIFIFCLSLEAKAESEGEKLISGCNELMGIYANRSEKRFLASQLVSASDTMLAGFCLGATKAYISENSYNCRYSSWYNLAEAIAGKYSIKDNWSSLREVLQDGCKG